MLRRAHNILGSNSNGLRSTVNLIRAYEGCLEPLLDRVARQTGALSDLAEGELVAQLYAPDPANHVHGDHLVSLMNLSAGQLNTLVNIRLALCSLHGLFCVGTNRQQPKPSGVSFGRFCQNGEVSRAIIWHIW